MAKSAKNTAVLYDIFARHYTLTIAERTSMDSYQKRLLRHLAEYKRSRLGISQSGTFRYRGKDVVRAHILPRELRWLNLLEPIRSEVRDYLKSNPSLRLHKYFHHLNSSQAFAFNLFFPYLVEGPRGSTALLKALGIEAVASTWNFEHVPFPDEETNVDVTWHASDGTVTYCEVKLSEADFGKAKADERHKTKLENIYRIGLSGQVSEALLEPEMFFDNYQILRNLWLGAKDTNARIVFLLPKANAQLWPALAKVLDQVTPALRDRVRVLAFEDIVHILVSDQSSPAQLRWYAKLLGEKYVLSNDTA